MRQLRTATRIALSRGGTWWTVPVTAVGWFELRRGALAPVVSEARARVDMPAHKRIQMIRWAGAVRRDSELSRRFLPGHHLRDPAAIDAAIDALRDRIGRTSDSRAVEQLIELDDSLQRDELLDIVRSDLSIALMETALRPKRGQGVDPAMLASVVGDVVDRLEAHGIQPFLMSGTLLGFVREGGFLPHDHDVDLGLLPDVDLDAVAAALATADLDLVTCVADRWIVAVHESGLHVDLFRHELRDGLLWHRTRIHEWWNTPFTLSELRVGGRRWSIPDDPERYLDENYGRWADPVAYYGISFDTPNRRYVDDFPAIRYLYATCRSAIDAGDRWLVESTVRELRDSFGVDLTKNLTDSPLLERPRPRPVRDRTDHDSASLTRSRSSGKSTSMQSDLDTSIGAKRRPS